MRNRSTLIAIVLIVGIMLLALGLRLYHLNAQSLWYDEGFSVYLSHKSPGEIVSQTAADIQPPLYYLMLHGWMKLFGDDEPAVRGLSVLFGVLTVPLIYGVARHLFRRHLAGLLAALLLAVSPLHIWYGQETRMYTLLVFLCLLSSYFLLLLASRSRQERNPGVWGDLLLWLAYTLTSVAATIHALFCPVHPRLPGDLSSDRVVGAGLSPGAAGAGRAGLGRGHRPGLPALAAPPADPLRRRHKLLARPAQSGRGAGRYCSVIRRRRDPTRAARHPARHRLRPGRPRRSFRSGCPLCQLDVWRPG